jgi:TonB family protein
MKLTGPLRNTRKTACGAISSWLVSTVRAAAFALSIFTMTAFAQTPGDAPGITVDSGGKLLHRPPVVHPTNGTAGGLVVLEATVDSKGEVTDARVVSGPEELRKSALTNVLQWHYSSDPTPPVSTRISMQFSAHDALPIRSAADDSDLVFSQSGRRLAVPPGQTSGVIAAIVVAGLSAELEQRVRERLPVRQGDRFDANTMKQVTGALRPLDEHLAVSQSIQVPQAGGEAKMTLRISLGAGSLVTPGLPPPPPLQQQQSDASGQRIRVGGNVQAANLLKKVAPAYPPAAKAARIQGTVSYTAIIGKDGSIIDLQLISGHPLLVEASTDAVKQWVYKPTLLNGQPVEIITQIDVNFTLSQ